MTRREYGLTLIELMVALAVFAILGTLTYRGTAHLIDSRQIIADDLARWRAIDRSLNIIEADLFQTLAPMTTAPRQVFMELTHTAEGSELQLVSLSGGKSVRRVGFRHAADRIEWRRWRGRDASGPAQSDTLLDKVSSVRWRFFGSSGWTDRWPTNAAAADAIPAGVEVQLDLADAGTVTRMYALR